MLEFSAGSVNVAWEVCSNGKVGVLEIMSLLVEIVLLQCWC